MASKKDGPVFEVRAPGCFGPAKQSIEIRNTSKKQLTVLLENSGSKYFKLASGSEKQQLKPGASNSVQVEFKPPQKGYIYSLKANYKAVIKVWGVHGKLKKKELLDLIYLTGTAPGRVPPDNVKCFDETSKAKKPRPKRKLKGRRAA